MTNLTTGGPRVTRLAPDEWQPPARGTWHWLTGIVEHGGPTGRHLVCVTHVGSNYVEFTGVGPGGYRMTVSWRVLFDELDAITTPAPDAREHIDRQVAAHRRESMRLLEEVRELTARLSIHTDGRALPSVGDHAQALAVRTGDAVPQYKADLIRAKDQQLPDLFKRIKEENELAAQWMRADLLPLQATLNDAKALTDVITSRIFNVELYAGLGEEMVEVRGGDPAPADTPVHVFQRRHYMDEECLARYEAGGMEFKHIDQFDAWLARPENLDRVLPHPRSVVAFRVRRRERDRSDEVQSIADFISIVLSGIRELDKVTFLYVRNGARLYRVNTRIEFGEQLFPSARHLAHDDALLASDIHNGSRMVIVSEGEFDAMCAAWDVAEAEYVRSGKAAEDKKNRWPWTNHGTRPNLDRWVRFTPETPYYDDIAKELQRRLDEHNRFVLVLQGLFDRSPALHPHPSLRLWEGDDFARHVVLVLDDERGLTTGAPPDFEVYRARLNASLRAGSHTVGQEVAWLEHEAERYNEARRRDWRTSARDRHEVSRYRPYGDPGPGRVATVASMNKDRTAATFRWERDRRTHTYGAPKTIGRRVTVPTERLLHVDAYTPGDYRLFYADPRTRAEYLTWAPLLLAAEDWHAKNRQG